LEEKNVKIGHHFLVRYRMLCLSATTDTINLQIDDYHAVLDNALFLFRQEKCQKKPTQGAL
jgi:hypothetical protein